MDSDENHENNTPKKKRMYRGELSKDEKKCRKQLFSNNWLNEDIFKSWLRAVPSDKSKAQCRACNVELGSKRSDLIKHSLSQRHLKKVKCLDNTQDISTVLNVEKQKKHIVADIRFSLLVVAHNFSFRSVNHITEVAKSNFNDSLIAKNVQQKRAKCTYIVKNVLSASIKERLCDELKDVKFSILVDESTDISNCRLLCILIKYTYNSVLKTQLLDLIKIDADEGTARGLYTVFKNCLKTFNLNVNNIVGYCSDNASVMMGNKESFKTYLLNDNPDIIINGCICHSAHLIAAVASQEIPSNIESFLQNISNYFSRSPKRQCILEEFQKYMHACKLKIISPSRTRWLALSNCVNRILEQWNVLYELFKVASFEDKNTVANLIYSEMNNPYVKAYLYFFKHILPVFNQFNLMFQSEKILVSVLYTESRRFVRILCSNFIKPQYYNDEINLDNLNVFDPHALLPLEELNVGSGTMNLLKDCNRNDNEQFKLRCLKFYQKAVSDAIKRFPVKDEFYKNLLFLTPENALNNTINCDITLPLQKYEKYVDKDKVKGEFNMLTSYFTMEEKVNLLNYKNYIEFWTKISNLQNFNGNMIFSNIGNFALLILIVPHGNAQVERVFSMMSDIKIKKRNRLLPETLSDLLRIKLDLISEEKCCITYPITDNHIKKFNQSMYNFKKHVVVPSSDENSE